VTLIDAWHFRDSIKLHQTTFIHVSLNTRDYAYPMVCNSEPIEQDGTQQPADEMSYDERRQARRHRTLKAAKLLPMEGWDARDGIVRDQSDTGARIAVEQPATVPDEFRLVVLKEATIQPVTVRWRDEKQLGVEYSGEAKPAPPRKL
jgi:hypothetical protein